MDPNEKKHISSYTAHGRVLVALLVLTTLSVAITWVKLGSFSVAVALLIAALKGTIVLTWFMHLKFDSALFRGMAIGVFILVALIIGITFIDYVYR